jgi:ABC-type transport system involved in multi-copper enzyme maturation permease subunit
MTAIARLTRAELRKLVTTPGYLIALAVGIALDVTAVVVDVAVAGKNGRPPLASTDSTEQMLKLGVVCCVAMLVLGIVAAGGEYRHRTIIPATLVTPRRGAQVAAKAAALTIAGVVLSGLTFGAGLATIVAELSAHGIHHLPAGTGQLYAESVSAATLMGVIGVALGYLTRSTVAAVVCAVGWVAFVELIVLRTVVPQLAKWTITGAAVVLTDPTAHGSGVLAPGAAAAVLAGYAAVLLAAATPFVLRRDIA